MKIKVNLFLFFSLLFLLFSCETVVKKKVEKDAILEVDSSLLRIIKRKKLIAATNYSPINYFIYRGQALGYEYEILKRFADYLNVDLEIRLQNDVDTAFECLNRKEFDLIALGLTITNERKEKILFSKPTMQTRQVLVQRKASYKKGKVKKLIRNPLDMDSLTVHILMNKMYRKHLQHLQEDMGIYLNIVEHSNFTLEELIDSVAAGKFDYVVCDEHIAKAYQKFASRIDIETHLSLSQNIAWGLAKDADSLKKKLDDWLAKFKETRVSKYIYNKYFIFPLQLYTNERYHSHKGGIISDYDPIFRKASEILHWDWRLLASLAYQESKFNPDVKSWVGAFGVMQLMPETAAEMGVDSLSTVRDQIFAGVRFLKSLDKQWKEKIPDSVERINFVLASYNVGIGHVLDARRLAHKYHKDTNVWKDNVDYFLLNKSKPAFFNDSVVKYGRCRGQEPYNFVKDINERFEEYQSLIPK